MMMDQGCESISQIGLEQLLENLPFRACSAGMSKDVRDAASCDASSSSHLKAPDESRQQWANERKSLDKQVRQQSSEERCEEAKVDVGRNPATNGKPKDRITMWNTITKRKLTGRSAPQRCNVPAYLEKHPEYVVFSNQKLGTSPRDPPEASLKSASPEVPACITTRRKGPSPGFYKALQEGKGDLSAVALADPDGAAERRKQQRQKLTEKRMGNQIAREIGSAVGPASDTGSGEDAGYKSKAEGEEKAKLLEEVCNMFGPDLGALGLDMPLGTVQAADSPSPLSVDGAFSIPQFAPQLDAGVGWKGLRSEGSQEEKPLQDSVFGSGLGERWEVEWAQGSHGRSLQLPAFNMADVAAQVNPNSVASGQAFGGEDWGHLNPFIQSQPSYFNGGSLGLLPPLAGGCIPNIPSWQGPTLMDLQAAQLGATMNALEPPRFTTPFRSAAFTGGEGLLPWQNLGGSAEPAGGIANYLTLGSTANAFVDCDNLTAVELGGDDVGYKGSPPAAPSTPRDTEVDASSLWALLAQKLSAHEPTTQSDQVSNTSALGLASPGQKRPRADFGTGEREASRSGRLNASPRSSQQDQAATSRPSTDGPVSGMVPSTPTAVSRPQVRHVDDSPGCSGPLPCSSGPLLSPWKQKLSLQEPKEDDCLPLDEATSKVDTADGLISGGMSALGSDPLLLSTGLHTPLVQPITGPAPAPALRPLLLRRPPPLQVPLAAGLEQGDGAAEESDGCQPHSCRRSKRLMKRTEVVSSDDEPEGTVGCQDVLRGIASGALTCSGRPGKLTEEKDLVPWLRPRHKKSAESTPPVSSNESLLEQQAKSQGQDAEDMESGEQEESVSPKAKVQAEKRKGKGGGRGRKRSKARQRKAEKKEELLSAFATTPRGGGLSDKAGSAPVAKCAAKSSKKKSAPTSLQTGFGTGYLGSYPATTAAEMLFVKKLTSSDTNHLGRIILPKSAAEQFLPAVDDKVGMRLVMEDSNGGRWCCRYRWWPNNKSRMYVLEHAGHYVRAFGLLAGDTVCFCRSTDGHLIVREKRLPGRGGRKGKVLPPSPPRSEACSEPAFSLQEQDDVCGGQASASLSDGPFTSGDEEEEEEDNSDAMACDWTSLEEMVSATAASVDDGGLALANALSASL